jgi:hypothetical protein
MTVGLETQTAMEEGDEALSVRERALVTLHAEVGDVTGDQEQIFI